MTRTMARMKEGFFAIFAPERFDPFRCLQE